METRSDNQLEKLDAKKREWLLELASEAGRLRDLIAPLKEHGIEVSVTTLRRFVRRHREERLAAEGEEMAGALERLAQRGKGEAFRKGTMEALRQKLYEEALSEQGTEGRMELYESLLKEEGSLKELELAERKTAALEERVRLEGLRLEARGRAQQETGKTRVEIGEAEVVEMAPDIRERESLLLAALRRLEEIINAGGPPEEKVIQARSFFCGERRLLGG